MEIFTLGKHKKSWLQTLILAAVSFSCVWLLLNIGLPPIFQALAISIVVSSFTIFTIRRYLWKFDSQLEKLTRELNLGSFDRRDMKFSERVEAVANKIIERNTKEMDYREEVFKEMGFGILNFGSDLKVKRASVKVLSQLIEGDLTGKSIIEGFFAKTTLNNEQLREVEFYFTSVLGMKEMQWKLSKNSFPTELTLKKVPESRSLKVLYVPIYDADEVKEISICMQDITEYKLYKSKAVSREQEIEKIFALLQVSESLFELFMEETRTLFNGLKKDLQEIRISSKDNFDEITGRMFRSVHTIKANAKLFKLTSIQDVSHEVEQYLSDLRSGQIPYDNKVLGVLTNKVMAISEEIYAYASLRKEILSSIDHKRDHNLKYRVQWIRSLLNQFAYILRDPKFEPRHLKTIQKEFGRALATFDRVSIREYIKGYDDMILDISRQLGKRVNKLETNLEYHYFEPNTLSRVNDILVHCIRNAVDHGIEDPETRKALGKPEKGTIKLSIAEQDGNVTVCIEDDGHGIEIPLVKQKAVLHNLVPEHRIKEMSDSEILELVFLPGFSTSEEVSKISGRGIGMEAVRDTVNKISGRLKIDTIDNQGTAITINIPTETEELLTPFMIYDLNDLLESLIDEYKAITGGQVKFLKQGESAILFGDRLSNGDQIRTIVNELLIQIPKGSCIEVKLETFKGRRRVDSHWFYRMSFRTINTSKSGLDLRITERLSTVRGNLKRISGSFIKRSSSVLEINIPSNIPVPFSSFEFLTLLVCDNAEKLQESVRKFFIEVMGGWDFDIIICRPGEDLPEKLHNQPCIVVMDDHHAHEYASMREECERESDGVLLLTSEDTDIEVLDELHIMPRNIIFVPRDSEPKTLDRAFASIILRRFLKDMIQKDENTGQIGIQRASGFSD